jgi:predicted MFS family arabinose efflux permease
VELDMQKMRVRFVLAREAIRERMLELEHPRDRQKPASARSTAPSPSTGVSQAAKASLSRSLPLSYTMLVLVGASMMAVFATVTSLVQLITTNEMRGRVMSVYNCAFRGGMPMGNLLSGWLVPMLTAPVVLGVNGLLLVILALYFLLVQRRVATL